MKQHVLHGARFALVVLIALLAFGVAGAFANPQAALAGTVRMAEAAGANGDAGAAVAGSDAASANGAGSEQALVGGQLLAPATEAEQEQTAPSPASQAKPKASLKVRARIQYDGWLARVKAGATAGTNTKKGLRAIMVKLSGMKNITGHVKYKTFDWGLGWGSAHKDGKSSGRASRAIRAVKIWLTGPIADVFDIKYRVFIRGKGWQPWAMNRETAGTARGSSYVSAIKVKLVQRLNGIDISSWQQGLDPKKVDADFIIVKATEGTWYTNAYFAKWAKATLESGKLLGAYHFVRTGDANKQADYFVKVVGDYIGNCALFLDWENTSGDNSTNQGVAWAKKFMDRVYDKTGVKPLIYMSKNVCRSSDWSEVASEYGLWVAQYAYAYQDAGTGYLADPWTDTAGWGAWAAPTLYQYTSMGYIDGYAKNLDLDLFYGGASDWVKLQSAA